MKPWSLNEEVKDRLISLYLQGLTVSESAKIVGCSYPTAYSVISSSGCIRDVSTRHRKYKLNDSVFGKITTERAAYWLGFLLADGSVSDNHCLSLTLKKGDLEHLIEYLSFLESKHPIDHYRNEVTVKINSKILCLDLHNYGIIPRKSLVARPEVQNLSSKLIRHFWRGVVDGDGHIGLKRSRTRLKQSWVIGLSGTFETITAFKDYLESQGIEGGGTYQPNKLKNHWRLTYNAKDDVTKISKLLYFPSRVYLDRKKALAQKIQRGITG